MRGIQYRPVDVEVMSPRHHRPQRSATTLLFWASPDTPITGMPRFFTWWPGRLSMAGPALQCLREGSPSWLSSRPRRLKS